MKTFTSYFSRYSLNAYQGLGLLILSFNSLTLNASSVDFDIKTHLDGSISSQSKTYNSEAVIPPQCYTKTESQFNPCYTCHQSSKLGNPNRMDDAVLQGTYAFSDVGVNNHWVNLFEDRRERIKLIDNQSIQDYVNQENYTDLPENLTQRGWQGYIPDIKNLHLGAQAFDELGFAKDNSGWVAFNYTPLPSTFWPTNGSTDDVMIRLPKKFQQDVNGQYSRDIYLINLTILEAAIKNMKQISIPQLDESSFGIDLNNDGQLGYVTEIVRPTHYIGQAEDEKVLTFLYPLNTEFLHTVRYVGADQTSGEIYNPKRMKEVRYMVKNRMHQKSMLGSFYAEEQRDKFEGNLPRYPTLGDQGVNNKFGWMLTGFIEDKKGDLRPQAYEEMLFCMGCHTTIGSIIDSTFSFARKADGAKGWGYIDLKKLTDVPTLGEDEGAIKAYLRRVGGGNEFRMNDEMQAKYFDENGNLNESKVDAEKTVYDLITPSVERAVKLNKAYKTIVDDQDFIFGRDANLAPATNVFKKIENGTEPLKSEFRHTSDIRLQWD